MQLVFVLFQADKGVLHASDVPVEGDPAVAALIAGNTVPDLLEPSFFRLVRHIRIAHLGPHHADHVRLTVSQHLFGQERIVDAPCSEDGKADGLLYACGQRNGIGERHVHAATDEVKVVEG